MGDATGRIREDLCLEILERSLRYPVSNGISTGDMAQELRQTRFAPFNAGIDILPMVNTKCRFEFLEDLTGIIDTHVCT